MRLLKPRTERVTRQEFETLSAQLESFQAITAIAIAAVEVAAKAGPGTPAAAPRTRLEKLAAAADLDSAESAALKSFLKRLDSLARIESRREFRENEARTRSLCADDFMPGGRLAPRF